MRTLPRPLRKTLIAALVLGGGMLHAPLVSSYNVERTDAGWPLRFGVWPVSVYLVAKDTAQVSAAQQEQTLQAAIEAWNTVAPDGALLRYGGLVRSWPGHDLAVALDDQFVVRGGEFLGRVRIARGEAGRLLRGEISVNSADFDFGGGFGSAAGKSAFDLQVALHHLLGHALGLAHSRQESAAMFFLPILPTQSLPTKDDAAGIQLLYGEAAASGGLCDACERDDQCAGGLCLSWPDGAAYCASACATHNDCPLGWSCAAWKDGLACLPNDGHCHPDRGDRPLSERCWSDAGCESGFCQSDGGAGFCTAGCPCAGASCTPSAIGAICVDRGGTPNYGRCWSGGDCASGFCLPAQGGGGWCASPCASGCAPGERCDGDWCVPASGSGPGGLGVGWPCATALDCASGRCEATGGRFSLACTATCTVSTDCPAGTGCTTSQTASRCVASPVTPFALGQPCATAGSCGQTRLCDLQEPLAGWGVCRNRCDPFATTDPCGSGERCVGLGDGTGICRPAQGGLGVPGQACSPASPCRADLICAGAEPQSATCRVDCLLDDDAGCQPDEVCLATTAASPTGVCGEEAEVVQFWSTPGPSYTNWAARAVDGSGLVAVGEVRRGSDAPEAPAGCQSQRQARGTPGLLLLVWAGAWSLVRRRGAARRA